jgi:hypothetical protein
MKYERLVRRGVKPLAAVIGLSAVLSCSSLPSPDVDIAINCRRHPGKSVEKIVDTEKVRSYGKLVLSGSDTFPVDVLKVTPQPHPNELLVGTSKSPVGVGGTKPEIDEYGMGGMPLFESAPHYGTPPPYYTLKAIGDPGSSMVTVRLSCSRQQS